MFLINSRLSLFTAAHFRGLPLSLSYGVNLPSSLTTLLPMALGFSPHLPVSVCGTDTTSIPHAFSRLITSDFATKFHSLTPGATNARYRLHSVSACLNCGGYGISTVCASDTLLSLSLAPAYLGRTNLPLETLDFRPLRFSRNSRYLFRHSHLCKVHDCIRYRFTPYTTLPYPACKHAA